MPTDDFRAAFTALYHLDLDPEHRVALADDPAHPAPEGWAWVLDCELQRVCMVRREHAEAWARLLNVELWRTDADR